MFNERSIFPCHSNLSLQRRFRLSPVLLLSCLFLPFLRKGRYVVVTVENEIEYDTSWRRLSDNAVNNVAVSSPSSSGAAGGNCHSRRNCTVAVSSVVRPDDSIAVSIHFSHPADRVEQQSTTGIARLTGDGARHYRGSDDDDDGCSHAR